MGIYQLATHTDAHEYTVTEHSQLSAFYIPAYRFIDKEATIRKKDV